VLVFDSSLEHQHSTLMKFSRKWFGPYVVVATHNNATYTLRELDGTILKIPVAGKWIKTFMRRDGRFNSDDIVDFETREEDEVKQHIQSQVKMRTCMNTKKIETWHIPEDVQV
jgi:hypothetical protein